MKEKIKIFTTTIIGGDFKGKKIEIPDISTTRSSKGILKESFFNTIQFEIIDKNFVEVFAGSGSVGLEALSRGATSATFIERHIPTAQLIRENLRALRIEDRADVLTTSTFLWIERLARGPALPSEGSHSVPTDDSAGPRMKKEAADIHG